MSAFVKTTGGKGLHVVVPIKPTLDWEQAKAFAKVVAQSIAAAAPELYVATISKSKRAGKIFIDYCAMDATRRPSVLILLGRARQRL